MKGFTMRSFKRVAVLASVLLVAACGPVIRESSVVSGPAQPHSVKLAAVIGGFTWPLLSHPEGIADGLRERGYTVDIGGPGPWPNIGMYDVLVCHSMGCDMALGAPPGPRKIFTIAPFTLRGCPEGATVYNYYNSDMVLTVGSISCAHNVAVQAGHVTISSDSRVQEAILHILDQAQKE